MSTTFAIIIKTPGMIKTIPIARRSGGKMYFVNDLAPLLPDHTFVKAIDNTNQGIYTVGDIKEAIETGDICPNNPEPEGY